MTHEHKPLNYGELTNLADLDVCVDAGGASYLLAEHSRELVPIVDAECDLVCFVHKDDAELMVRLINTYQWSRPTEEEET